MISSKKTVFVTVGTTKFDKLIKTILCSEVLEALSSRGYSEIILQIGNSILTPDCIPRCGILNMEYFRLHSSVTDYVQSADLIISHAGAGSILDALEANKHLIVVTNQLLMNNHQLELAEQLYVDGHLFYCTCETLLNVILTMDLELLRPFVNSKSKNIASFVNKSMGFKMFHL